MRTKLIHIISHAAGWLLFFSLITGFLSNSAEGSSSVFSQLLAIPFLIFYGVYLVLFYINYLVLIPQLYFKKNYLLYFFIILLLFIAVYFIRPFDRLIAINPPPGRHPRIEGMNDRMPPPEPPGNNGHSGMDITSIILFVTVWSLSTVICIIRQWRMTEQRAMQAETGKANAELSFLKAQVNPHFLFNTLNNIYSLAVTKNENTAESIMKLSNIMRYITDDVRENYVPLDNEVECMRDYIDLQRMRLGSKMKVDFSVSGNTTDKKIAPLILMTFIENVFKYGTSNHEPSDIMIRLSADAHHITFFCQNKLFNSKRNTERTGTGILNARKRLDHLYPNNYFLDINTENELFTVQLSLQV